MSKAAKTLISLLLPKDILDFPFRGQKVALYIKRRRWTLKSTGKIIQQRLGEH